MSNKIDLTPPDFYEQAYKIHQDGRPLSVHLIAQELCLKWNIQKQKEFDKQDTVMEHESLRRKWESEKEYQDMIARHEEEKKKSDLEREAILEKYKEKEND